MKVIGIVGGIGSGKSTVAGMFEALGAESIAADEIGHQILSKQNVKQALTKVFGIDIMSENGRVCRGKLSEAAFKDDSSIEKLNEITHPEILKDIQKKLHNIENKNPDAIVVIDAALLLEFELHTICDYIVFVEAEEENRRKRVAYQRQWNAFELARREKFQKSLICKRKSADYAIDNNRSLEDLKKQVEHIWSHLREKDTVKKKGSSKGSSPIEE